MGKTEIKTLILSGGGVKGFAYIGALKKLSELGKLDNLQNIISVSIGSVFGLLYLLGYEYDELYEEFINKNLHELVDYKLSNLVKNYGFESGKLFMSWLETLLLRKGISHKITFNELFKLTNIKYSVMVTNLNSYTLDAFNHETMPKMRILKAIRMAISLPLILTKQNYKDNIYIDGGVVNNLPMYLAEDDFPNILAIHLKSLNDDTNEKVVIDSIDKYMYHVCNCFFRYKTKIEEKYTNYIIDINISKIESFNWNISQNDKIRLIETGYKETEKYFFNIENNFIE